MSSTDLCETTLRDQKLELWIDVKAVKAKVRVSCKLEFELNPNPMFQLDRNKDQSVSDPY